MARDPDAVTAIRDHVNFNPLQSGAPGQSPLSPWQKLPELPTAAELLNPGSTTNDLPVFPIDRPFSSKEEYLEVLYRILRFEGIEGLRFSVNDLRSRPSMADDQNTCVYTKVHIKGYLMARLGPICRITFSTRRAGRRIKWKQSKRLLPGRIIALSTDNFKKDCRVAVVAQRPFEDGLDQLPPSIDIFWADTEQAVVDPDQELVMVESRNGFYEAVRHALTGLQQATGTSTFDKYLVSLDDGDSPTKSIAATPNFDLTSLISQLTLDQLEQAAGNKHIEQLMFEQIASQYREYNILHRLPPNSIGLHTSLDSSQVEALQRMISKEVAIVQGPPGTGKTFTSVKALMVMLHNRRRRDPPIIIAAQTNHALDQLLIYCHSAGAKIMRVGGRTENEVIKERTVYNLRNSARKMATDGRNKSLEKGRLRIVERFADLVAGVFGDQGLIDPAALFQAGIINEAQLKSLTDEEWEGAEGVPPMQMWLADEQIERFRQPGDDVDFTEEEPIEEELDPDLQDEALEDDEDRLRGTWVPLTSYYTGKTPRVTDWKPRCIVKLDQCDDLYDIPLALRGGVYQILQSRLRDTVGDKFRAILGEAVSQAREQKVNKWIRDLHVIDTHRIEVIGCTTTGLSKYRGFLSATKARILLIEEAAETREANVTSALCTFQSLDQLVLVGDHQQLPPQCDISRLGDAPFHLNTSLFERLVRNGVPYTMLNRQRRMAPELRFIVQQYYPNLLDHPTVENMANRPLVPGMGDRRSWFFTHEWPEETDADSSKFNTQEAEMVVAFMRYLVQNGVEASQITVLTYYRGQRKKILQLLRRDVILMKTSYFNVATVDSYQGEENEIVLLSLVRSPQPGDIARVGFLESQNRATVAISRARRGFYMFGNKQNLLGASDKSFSVWGPIWNGFAIQKRVATSKGLPLTCQNHEKEIWTKKPEDFVGNAGGCWVKCDGTLPCGHPCALMCHTVGHEMLPCLRPCPKRLSCGHKCAGVCTDKCSCAEKCRSFNLRQAEQQMAELQVHGTDSSSGYASQSGAPARNTSPEKWQHFSRDPRTHDEAIRQARLREMTEQQTQHQPLLSLGTHSTTIGNSSVGMAPNVIQEKFISVENKDGRRVLGGAQDIGHVGGGVQRDGRTKKQGRQEARSQAKRQTHRNEAQRPLQPAQVRQSASKKHHRFENNETLQPQPQPPVYAGPRDIRQIGSQQQRIQHTQTQGQSYRHSILQHQSAANANAVEVFPNTMATTQGLDHLSESNIDESDIGFEAEVLGIRRSRRTQVDTNALREGFGQHLPRAHQEGPQITFEDPHSVEPQCEAGAKEPTFPKGNNEDEDSELLIDI
ncbi:hypothetical protein VMCG_06750 [Cytospora schulzeri]|uniref:Helicase ATP-binding domain-containing protein n=1 Tax=Cytospora schulzeri TaxID=448051 RepID=A0A423W5Q0_9PEZI|nr:hypothetical protein VMCG_06750 [Valsa malicola]